MDNVWDVFRTGQNSVLAPQAAQMHQATQGMGILSQMQKQQQEQAVRGILSQAKDLQSALPALLKAGPLGIQTAHQLAQVQGEQAKMAQTQRTADFYSPQNLAKFTEGGAPAIAPGAEDLGGGPGRPEQPGTLNFPKFLQAGAAQGVVNPEVYANHLAQREQAKAAMEQAAALKREQIQKDYDIAKQRSEDKRETEKDRIAARREMAQLAAGLRQPAPLVAVQGENGPVYTTREDALGKAPAVKETADKAIPAPIVKAYTENSTALRKIDTALSEIEKYPNAFGLKRLAGDKVNQRVDPQGVDARAIVGDIGSLKIHDRSGAAVTAAEFPRLKPFIPTVDDTPDTIKKKLNQFRKEYVSVQSDLQGMYAPDQGYKSFPASSAPAGGKVEFNGYSFPNQKAADDYKKAAGL